MRFFLHWKRKKAYLTPYFKADTGQLAAHYTSLNANPDSPAPAYQWFLTFNIKGYPSTTACCHGLHYILNNLLVLDSRPNKKPLPEWETWSYKEKKSCILLNALWKPSYLKPQIFKIISQSYATSLRGLSICYSIMPTGGFKMSHSCR